MTSDEELMVRVIEGERSALELLFARWEGPLFAFFYRQGCPPGAVEELTEETLVCLFRQRRRYDPRRPFAPWLFGVARLVWKGLPPAPRPPGRADGLARRGRRGRGRGPGPVGRRRSPRGG